MAYKVFDAFSDHQRQMGSEELAKKEQEVLHYNSARNYCPVH